MTLFKDKYRIQSARLRHWDYSATGSYFVTICTKERACFFGDVTNTEVKLSPVGRIVAEEWQKTPFIRQNVELDEWQIMPNHLHVIVVIKEPRAAISTAETAHRAVSTGQPRNLRPRSLGSIIGQFKAACTKRIWAAGFRDFAWQSRFYDHIIRDRASLDKIRDYIIHNPLMWETDKDNPENLCM